MFIAYTIIKDRIINISIIINIWLLDRNHGSLVSEDNVILIAFLEVS